MVDGWKVGDKIGPVSQTREPKVLTSWGEVVEVHEDGLTVQWPGEKSTNRHYYTDAGMKVVRG